MDPSSLDPLDSTDATRSRGPGTDPPPSGSAAGAPRSRRRMLPHAFMRQLATRFQLLDVLGRGAMGVVYKAREADTGRLIALKVLQVDLDERRRTRFRREGEITAALQHPGIVTIHSAGEIDGIPYLAYELVPHARTLRDVLPRVDRRRRVVLLRDVAAALGYAHAHGVIHRDVKPENVLVTPQGEVRVADFGLAAAHGLARLTRTGAMLGTPSFMAPEQVEARHGDVGPPSDVWALGVILYEALTGELPFSGGSLIELGSAITRAQPTPPRTLAPDLPPDLEAVTLKALRADPRQRYPDGAALARDLAAWLEGEEVAASRLSTVLRRLQQRRSLVGLGLAGGVCVGLVAAAGAALGLRGSPAPPVDARPPELRLLRPVTAEVEVWERSLVIEGVVAGETAPCRVRVGQRSLRAAPGQPFELHVPLEPGPNRVVVEVVDAAGNAAPPLELSVACWEAPAWYGELPPERRCPLPLSPGLAWGEAPGQVVNVADGSILRWVPPGRFVMGTDGDLVPGAEPEGPAHEVTLTRGFFVGAHEVTRSQYRRFCRETERVPPPEPFPQERDHPITGVSWADAAAYCAWAGLRLPTEAEWEWAARGPDGRLYPWGPEEPDSRRANLDRGDLFERTAPVGSFVGGASPFGCLDMVGNVWEWVADRFGPYPAASLVDPTGPATSGSNPAEPGMGDWRVHRGGAWNSTRACRATSRARAGEHYNSSSLGFRVARSP